MHTKLICFVIVSLLVFVFHSTATVYYVNGSNAVPVSPFTTWATAATNIQDAIDVSSAGDTVLVTNGIYAFGGRNITGGPTNRIALTNSITVQSVNGPWVTTIYGSGAVNGTSAVRCAWLTNGASLVGFTLMGGATLTTGSTITSDSGGGVWCASTNSFIDNCIIASNTAYYYGGGVYQGKVSNSLIITNVVNFSSSGGAYQSILNNCTIVNNRNFGVGNPVAMTNCIIYNNTAGNYSGANGTAYSHCCTTPALPGTGNFTTAPQFFTDGVHLSQNSPCIGVGVNIGAGTDIFGMAWSNPPSVGCAEWQPGPVIMNSPTVKLSGSPAGFSIGNMAINGSSPFNFVWFQNGLPLQDNGHFSSTQSSNLIATGILSSDAGSYQLVISNAFGVVTSAVAQVVIHCVNASGTSPASPYVNWATAATNIQDAIEAASTGDIVLVTNGFYSTGGEVISGGLTNRVALDKPILVTSVNGYSATMIQGAWSPASSNGTGPAAVRCAYVMNGGILNGFTLQNGATLASGDPFAGGPLESGGGIYCISTNGLVSNCVLSNNIAIYGGGIANGTLNNSLVYYNQAMKGGGAYDTILNNCTVGNNYILPPYLLGGAGIYYGTSAYACRNCIVINNVDWASASTPDNYYLAVGGGAMFSYCCISPTPVGGTGNINVNPQLLDLFHIASTSPCRGAGNAAYAVGTDLDGEAWANPPSMGCDEVVFTNLVGPLSANLFAYSTSLITNRPSGFWGNFTGRASTIGWSFGDGGTVTNASVVAHEWTNFGTYPVTFTVYNNDNPTGVSATVLVQVQPLLTPQIQPAGIVGSAFQFQFSCQNADYTVQYTTNLSQPAAWQPLQYIFGSYNPSNIVQINDSAWTNGTRFYRVVAQ